MGKFDDKLTKARLKRVQELRKQGFINLKKSHKEEELTNWDNFWGGFRKGARISLTNALAETEVQDYTMNWVEVIKAYDKLEGKAELQFKHLIRNYNPEFNLGMS